jgi:acyl-CoA dehydrogenase
MGAVTIAPEVFNCNAPDTGNMEVLERYGTEAQKARWLPGLMAGETRSAYLMTEPGVASSDATQISLKCERQGEDYVLNGEKYWATGAGDPRCSLYILMACSDPRRPGTRVTRCSGPRRQRRDRGAAPDAGLRP